MKKEMKTDIKK